METSSGEVRYFIIDYRVMHIRTRQIRSKIGVMNQTENNAFANGAEKN